jgi:hypothetical protein
LNFLTHLLPFVSFGALLLPQVAYKNHLASGYFEVSMAPLIAQYTKKTTEKTDNAEVLAMHKRENTAEEISLKNSKKGAIPPEVEPPKPPSPEEVRVT